MLAALMVYSSAMVDYVGRERPARVDVLLTECSMSDNVALQYPDLDLSGRAICVRT